jgi:hypothetical protein
VLLGVFGGLMAWTIWQGLQKRVRMRWEAIWTQELEVHAMPFRRVDSGFSSGLVLLIVSSRILVWGAVEIAHGFGVSDLIIGLTIVALGTSLPELASSAIATRKGEHDIALGNVLGSNLFNTLAVVGIAGVDSPHNGGAGGVSRDMLVMAALTVSLFVIGYGFRGINPGTHQPHRGRGAAGLLCGLYGLPGTGARYPLDFRRFPSARPGIYPAGPPVQLLRIIIAGIGVRRTMQAQIDKSGREFFGIWPTAAMGKYQSRPLAAKHANALRNKELFATKFNGVAQRAIVFNLEIRAAFHPLIMCACQLGGLRGIFWQAVEEVFQNVRVEFALGS